MSRAITHASRDMSTRLRSQSRVPPPGPMPAPRVAPEGATLSWRS